MRHLTCRPTSKKRLFLPRPLQAVHLEIILVVVRHHRFSSTSAPGHWIDPQNSSKQRCSIKHKESGGLSFCSALSAWLNKTCFKRPVCAYRVDGLTRPVSTIEGSLFIIATSAMSDDVRDKYKCDCFVPTTLRGETCGILRCLD